MGHIEASGDTLLRQASMTAAEYLNKAIAEIDEALGTGYAKEHPELIAAFMKVAASDMNYASLAKAQSEALEAIANAINGFADKIDDFRNKLDK